MSHSTQLIDGDGNFNEPGLDNFIREVKLTECGLSYAVVAIIGRQSTGKSTLMNHLFQTDFREMNAMEGRTQTTTGVWIGRCVGIQPCTIALDVEGSESSERGEGHIFEKQSSLFVLAVSDVVLINMWAHEIGLAGAASKYLLSTVFEVMLRLFNSRKTKLLFVLRDKTETPFALLDKQLKKVIEKIWDETPKPRDHKRTKLYDVFKVEVVALPHFKYLRTEFNEEVNKLRQRFCGSISPGGLAGDRQGVIAASGFSLSLKTIWKQIKENKDLDLPAHKVMVANARCEEIAYQKLKQLMEYAGPLLDLQAARETGPEKGFGERLSSILDKYLQEYDIEAMDFDSSIRSSKRRLLMSSALNAFLPAYNSMLGNLCSELFKEFELAFKEELLKKGQSYETSVKLCTNSCMADFRARRADASPKQADWAFESFAEKLEREILEHTIPIHLAYLAEQNSAQQRSAEAQAAHIAELQATAQRKAEEQATYIAELQATQKNAETHAVHIAELKATQQRDAAAQAAIIADLQAIQQRNTEENNAKIAELQAKFELEARERHRLKWEDIIPPFISKVFSWFLK